jgi:hypothetical protein
LIFSWPIQENFSFDTVIEFKPEGVMSPDFFAPHAPCNMDFPCAFQVPAAVL